MSAFTPVVADEDFLQVDIANEIIKGVQERVQVSSGTPPGLAEVDHDAHSASFWANLQSLCEAIAPQFYDPTPGAGGYAGETEIPAYTLETFREVAGLHPDGFRRATAWDPAVNDWTNLNDGMYSYGLIQPDDIFGPWIYVDLQSALKALLWTRLTNRRKIRTRYGVYELAYDCAEAKAAAIAGYAEGWSGLGDWQTGSFAYRVISLLFTAGAPYGWAALDQRYSTVCGSADARLTLFPQAIDCYEVYRAPVITEFDPTPNPTAVDFLDFDGLGVSDGVFRLFETLPLDDVATRDRSGGEIGQINTDPFDISGVSCPDGGLKGFEMELFWLARWQFTNA